MKATDLMLGDYVKVKPSGMIIKVAAIHQKKVGYHSCQSRLEWVRRDLIEPIPLTPEILGKNGFELKNDGWLCCAINNIEDKNYIFIQYRKGCQEVRLCEMNFVNNVIMRSQFIQYVHELQHALKLCRVKKEIEL
jgi:hypothetical protein